jgi:hypothetical protein
MISIWAFQALFNEAESVILGLNRQVVTGAATLTAFDATRYCC